MESFLKQNKDIDVVVAQNDNMAFGAIDALKAAGKTPGKDVTIISFDAIKAALKKVQSGEINAEFECNPLHGPRVAELAKKIMKGEKVDKIQYVDEQVFTKDNTTKEVIKQTCILINIVENPLKYTHVTINNRTTNKDCRLWVRTI